jgi:hypothetical protein
MLSHAAAGGMPRGSPCLLVGLLLVLMWAPFPAFAEKRLALLIGNEAYASEVGRLANPHNDVALLERALTGLGFDVAIEANATLGKLYQAVNGYARRLQAAGPNAVGFFYYSGHGASDGINNYLIPVDVKTTETGELWDQSLRLTEIMRKLKSEAGNATHFVVFDACRNTLKLSQPGSRAVVQAKGFVPVAQENGMLIAYATAEGELASDAGAGAGPYAKVLAEEIVKPGIEAVAMFRAVQRRVRTTISQEPYLGFSAMGDVYLGGKSDTTVSRPAPVTTGIPTYEQQAELAFWGSVKDSKDPATLQMYLNRFPNGTFAELAKLMMAQAKREVDQRAIQDVHEEAAREAGIKRQEAETQRVEAELKARAAEAARQQEQLTEALQEAKRAREALKAADIDRRAAQASADEARRSAEALKSEREAQTEAAQKWTTVKEATNPAALENFIRQYGDTVFGAIARARLDDISRQAASQAAPAAVAKQGETRARAEEEAQARAEQLVRERLAMLQKQQEEEKKLADVKAAQRPSPNILPVGAIRAEVATASVLRALAVSPGGTELAVSADDGVIRIIDLATFRLLRHFPLNADGVSTKTLAYSSDGSELMAGRSNGKVEIWNAATGSKLDDLKSSSSKVFAVAYYPPELDRYAASAGSDGVEIWNLRRKTVQGRPKLHAGAVRTVAYSSEKTGFFVSGGEDGQLVFYLPSNRQKSVHAHRGGVFAATFSPDNSTIVTGGADGLVKIWDAKSQTEQRSFQGHSRYVLSVALSKSAAYIASGGADRSVRIWSRQTGKPLQVLEGHEKDIECVSFLGTDNLVASVSEDKTLRVWDVVHGTQLLTAVFYPDGDYVAYDFKGRFTGLQGVAKRLEIGTGEKPRPLSDSERQTLFRPEGFIITKLAKR